MEKIPFHEFRSLPAKSGVYTVLAGALALYVGSSRNLKKRFAVHKRRKEMLELGADAIHIEFCSVKELAALEMKTIYQHHPSMNGLTGRPLKEGTEEEKDQSVMSIRINLPLDEMKKLKLLKARFVTEMHLTNISYASLVRFLINAAAENKLTDQTTV